MLRYAIKQTNMPIQKETSRVEMKIQEGKKTEEREEELIQVGSQCWKGKEG